MGRPPVVDPIAPGISPGLHGPECVVPVLVSQRAATAAEIRVDRREIGVLLVAVTATGIGLPDF